MRGGRVLIPKTSSGGLPFRVWFMPACRRQERVGTFSSPFSNFYFPISIFYLHGRAELAGGRGENGAELAGGECFEGAQAAFEFRRG
jgi:hypothetical protein